MFRPLSWERERRLGQTPAAFGAHVGIDAGLREVLDAAGTSEFVDIRAAIRSSTPPNAIEVDDDVAGA